MQAVAKLANRRAVAHTQAKKEKALRGPARAARCAPAPGRNPAADSQSQSRRGQRAGPRAHRHAHGHTGAASTAPHRGVQPTAPCEMPVGSAKTHASRTHNAPRPYIKELQREGISLLSFYDFSPGLPVQKPIPPATCCRWGGLGARHPWSAAAAAAGGAFMPPPRGCMASPHQPP